MREGERENLFKFMQINGGTSTTNEKKACHKGVSIAESNKTGNCEEP